MASSHFHRLKSLSIIGGFLDDQSFELADALNCIIGARGTGKTTVLEFVRYALDEMPSDTSACRRIESLVDKNLEGGRVQLGIETRDGLSYIISRSAGDDPIVLTEDGKPTEITLKTGGFFRADIYSQNEVENIADQALSQLDLIDNFEAEEIAEIERRIKSAKADLASNASNIMPLEDKKAALEEEIGALPSIEEKLKAFKGEGDEDSKEIDKAHEMKALRDREKRLIQSTAELLEEMSRDLAELIGRISLRTESLGDRDMMEGPNAETLREILDGLRACGGDVDKLLQEARSRIEKEQEDISARESKLGTAHNEQEIKFRELIEKHKEARGKATERSRLEKLRNELKAKERSQTETVKQLKELRENRTALTERLSELRDERFTIRKQIVDHINANLSPHIRVSIVQYGNPEKYRALLENGLRPARVRRGQVAQKIVNAFWPADFTEVIKEKNSQTLVDKAELNHDQANKVMAVLSGSSLLFELETVELIDLPKVELNDGGTYKDTGSLSTGQKCTTILPILLLETEHPLLIDQPEDNLDNRFVFETIVDSIRKVKKKRQLVFITHNPNIPVLGDAEKVFVLDSDGTNARKTNEGTVDECRDDIVTLLEGGKEAFDMRKERYSQ